jgi:hypothetical protein
MALAPRFAGLAIAQALAACGGSADDRPTACIEAGAGNAQTTMVSTKRSAPRSVRAVPGRPAVMQRASGEPEGTERGRHPSAPFEMYAIATARSPWSTTNVSGNQQTVTQHSWLAGPRPCG